MKRGFVKMGVTAKEFAEAMLAGLHAGKEEIGYGTTANAVNLSPDEEAAIFARMNPQ